jgi:hypothetical protein
MKNIPIQNDVTLTKMETFLSFQGGKSFDLSPKDWLLSLKKDTKSSLSLKANYRLNVKESSFNLEQGDMLSISHCGLYQCSGCTKKIKKLYSGYCYVCLTKKACADLCVLNPHLCHFAQGTCREPQWGLDFCYQPHFVYLSFTDKYKVGITRKQQLFTRLVDQGATVGAPLCLVSSRAQAGQIEKALTQILADKSSWQRMLKTGNERPSQEEFQNKFEEVSQWIQRVWHANEALYVPQQTTLIPKTQREHPPQIEFFHAPHAFQINYPVVETGEKIKSMSLEKLKKIDSKILGIKGQYLFFEEGVFNMRNHEGFVISLEKY